MTEKKAGFLIRLQAHLIDWQLYLLMIIGPISLFVGKLPKLEQILPATGIFLYLVIFILPLISNLYHITFTSKFGGGIGKLVSGIKVVYEDGKLLTFWQSAFRLFVGYFVSGLLFGLGFFWIIKDQEKQGWHDKISGTRVLYSDRNKRLIGTVFLTVIIIINAYLINQIAQSINQNKSFQEEIILIFEDIGKQLENNETPATIEPQEQPLII